MIALYYQIKTLIGFWCRRRLNLKSLIQLSEILLIETNVYLKAYIQCRLNTKRNCRVTSFSPHLSRNRKWAQQAQYNRFVREWVKELG